MTDSIAGKLATLQRLAQLWLSADNVSLIVGIALMTRGAWLFSERAGYLTCGSLVLALTLLHLIFGGRR